MTNREKLARKRAGAGVGNAGAARGGAAVGGAGAAGPGRNAGGAKGKDGIYPGGGKGGGKKKQFQPWKTLKDLETDTVLDGKDLREGARALTALELRPALHGYKQLAKQLTRQRNATRGGIATLGTRLSGDVSDVYRNIAQSAAGQMAVQQAIANQLGEQSAAIGNQSAASSQTFQEGQLGEYQKALEMRGAPAGGAAGQELANVAAEQQAGQAGQSAAAQQRALQQGASFGQLQAAMAGATQMQGGSTVGGIARAAQNRAAASDEKFNQAIQEALGKWGDAKATKGATMVKNVLGLREKEQKFSLGKAAVQGEKAKLKLEGEEFKEEKRQNRADNRLDWAEHELKQWEAENPEASNKEKKEKKQEIKKEGNEVRSMIPSLVSVHGAPWEAEVNGKPVPLNKAVDAFILALNEKVSADPQLVRQIVKNWVEKKYKKIARDPSPNGQGR